MGLLDQITELIGGNGENIFDQIKEKVIQGGLEKLTEKYPQLQEFVDKLDPDQIEGLIDNIKENGIPKDFDSITELIKSFQSNEK